MTVARDVLESLPQSLYRSLPWAAHTIDSCVKIVAEARRTNNPRRVRAWIDFERATPSGEEILACLDNVLHQMTLPGEAFADRVRFANKIRQEAVNYLRSEGAMASAQSTLDPQAAALADGLLAALRLHDPELADHSAITAELATRLAVSMGLDAATVARVTLAARLHDIGKMRIPRSITGKPMPLTAAERAEVQSYPKHGADTLAAMPTLAHIAAIVGAQREWFDGRGYPARLGAPATAFVADFVGTVVGGWDAATITDRLELRIGPDLQFVRINGTLVGFLVGGLVYAVLRVTFGHVSF